MPLDALIFDFDGLIIDTESLEFESVAEVFRDHGTELSFPLWQTFIGTLDHVHWTDVLAEQLGRPVDADALRAERRLRTLAALEELPILDGVLELIDEGSAVGLPMAVASSSSADWVVPHLTRLELIDRFAAVCTGDQVPTGKPSPDVYLLAAERLGVSPPGAVAIEDSPTGCVAARAAGMAVVAVPSAMTRGLPFPAADHVVTSAAELDLAALAALVDRLRDS